MNFSELKEKSKSYIINICNHLAPNGKIENNEYVALNPTRPDNSLGSFRINLQSGKWADFSSRDRGGDMIDLWSYCRGVDAKTAYNELSEFLGQDLPKIKMRFKEPQFRTLNTPAPREPTQGEFRNDFFGDFISAYFYRDLDNKIIMADARFEKTTDGKTKKSVIPYSWGVHIKSNRERFCPVSVDTLPLYNLAGIAHFNSVLFVEGAKCASMAQEVIGDKIAVTCYSGGPNSIDKVDFSPLKDKRVYIWPDNDQPGYELLGNLSEKIKDIVQEVKGIKIPDDKPKKWDVADFIEENPNANDLINFIKQNLYDIYSKKPKESHDYLNDNTPDKTSDAPFRCLGHNREHFYYLPKSKGQIVKLTASAHNSANLIILAPRYYWEQTYQGKNGASWSWAAEDLMWSCMKSGIFHQDKIRGRGAWNDGDKTIIHLGDKIILEDNKVIDPVDFKGQFIYERSVTLKSKTDEMSTNKDGEDLIELCKSFPWKSEVHGVLAAGWLFLAPICGALYWRPHIWITGEAGSGKTWFGSNVIKPFISGFGVLAQGNSSAAGHYQTLLRDALPVFQDESESNERKGAERVQEIIEIARQSSMPGEAVQLKGSAGGEAVNYISSSMFAFASIVTAIKHQADEGRITLLELMSWTPETEFIKQREMQEHFAYTDNMVSKLFPAGRADHFRNRAFRNIKNIKKNIEIFRKVCAKIFGTQRSGDQIGTLLAGAFCSARSGIVSEVDAERWIKSHDFSEHTTSSIGENDHEAVLRTLLQYVIKIKSGVGTIEKSIEQVVRLLFTVHAEEVTKEDCRDALERYGIYVSRLGEKNYLRIVFKHTGLDRIFKDTSWAVGYHRMLKRIEGAQVISRKIKKPNGDYKSANMIEIDPAFIIEEPTNE